MSIMTEEEKAKAEAEAKEFEASLEGLSEEEKAQKIAEKEALSKHNTDIEKALETERKKREKAEGDLEETRRKARERFEKKHKDDEFAGDNEEKPVTLEDIKGVLGEERESLRKEMRL